MSVDLTQADCLRSNGVLFPKDGKLITGKIRGSLRANSYEQKETWAGLKTVRDGDTVLELGAGIGYMSSLLATKRALKAVHAFEANPVLIPYIRAVHKVNKLENAHVHHAILGRSDGKAKFYVRRNFLGSSLSPEGPSPVLSEEEVEVRDCNRVIAELSPNVLVMDIEGAESWLIPAMDLSGIRAAIVELHPQIIGPEGVNSVFGAFMAAGLAYYARPSTGKVVVFRRSW